jgi:hypothetical protein
MKYLFVAGAPGSKWSSVVKNIYYSPDVDRGDYRDEWTYYHDAPGYMDLMHLGAYFDPGMESDIAEDITKMSRSQLETVFDSPFAADRDGVRIIKSHIFSYRSNIDHLRRLFPESPVVLVYRPNDACLGWWVKCGHFEITYPSYHAYYKNLREMSSIIARQNAGIVDALADYPGTAVEDNVQLCRLLGIRTPAEQYRQNYASSDVTVKII